MADSVIVVLQVQVLDYRREIDAGAGYGHRNPDNNNAKSQEQEENKSESLVCYEHGMAEEQAD